MQTNKRPQGSNADEWLLFLTEHTDEYCAVQIAEAIEEAERRPDETMLGALRAARSELGRNMNEGFPETVTAYDLVADAIAEMERRK